MKNYQWVKDKIEKLLIAKVICSSKSSWSAPITVVPTGDRGKWLVINYRTLNKVTRKFTWPMSKVEDIFSKLNGAKYFSTVDLRAGYHHIPLEKSLVSKTAFSLAQVPAYFQELMTRILKDFHFGIAYLNDIIIFSKTAEKHLSHIRKVFGKLRSAKLSMKLNKCHFFSKEIEYLGHILSTKGIHPLPSKTQAIQKMHPPITVKQICPFLEMVGYYRKFIKFFCEDSKAVNLTHKTASKVWMDSRTSGSLHEIERFHHTGTNSTLSQPQKEIYSLHRCFRWCLQSPVNTGTWWYRISNCLPVSHFFGNPEKVEYHSTRGLWSLLCHNQMELLSSRHRHHCQEWPQATCKIFEWKNTNNKVNRWGLELATYNITFEWISAAKNKAADCLSCLVELPSMPSASINMVSVSNTDGPW